MMSIDDVKDELSSDLQWTTVDMHNQADNHKADTHEKVQVSMHLLSQAQTSRRNRVRLP